MTNRLYSILLGLLLVAACGKDPEEVIPDPGPGPDPAPSKIMQVLYQRNDTLFFSSTSNGIDEKMVFAPTAPNFIGEYDLFFSGSKIIYYLYSSLNKEPGSVYAMNFDGSENKLITDTAVYDLAITPDEKSIIYVKEGDSNIYIADMSGKNERKLTNYTAQHVESISISPDGKLVVYSLYTSPLAGNKGDEKSELYSMNIDGSNPQLILADELKKYNTSPRISPDGKSIVYSNDDGIYVCDIKGENAQLILSDSIFTEGYDEPAWSVDGSRLLFAAYADKNDVGTLYSIQIDGKSLQKHGLKGDGFLSAWKTQYLY